MTPNVLISVAEREVEALFRDDFIAHIDGKQVVTLRQFYEEVADLLEIPDFGFTLEALNDSLNDLGWLEDERIIFYFTDTSDFLSKERDPAKIVSVLNVLEATAEDWKWTHEDEDEQAKEIVLIFEESDRILNLLANENIDYEFVSNLNSNE